MLGAPSYCDFDVYEGLAVSANKKVGLANNVTCLIVTYQDRRSMLRQVIQRIGVLQPTVRSIIIVFNGVPYDPIEFVREFDVGPLLESVIFEENMGSAHGYAAALDCASRVTSTDYYWLLDDDNLPEEKALYYLELSLDLLNNDIDCLLLAVREDRWEYLSAVHTGSALHMRNNAFFGFHLGKAIKQQFVRSKAIQIRKQDRPAYPLMEVGHGPYGGLLMHRQWIERVGLPAREFFVYEDDHEYTNRIVRAGGIIYLCAASRIEDIEESWFVSNTGGCHYLVDPDASGLKSFFVLRNRVHLESERYIKSQALYKLNAIVFMMRVVVTGYRRWLDRRFWMRLRLLAAAYREGRSGSLRAMSHELKHWIDSHG